MTNNEIMTAYMKWSDAIIRAGDEERWIIDTPEVTATLTTDEVIAEATECLNRVAEQIDPKAFVEAYAAEYDWIYTSEWEGKRYDYTDALDRFQDLEPWEKILLDKYIEGTGGEIITSDREVLAFVKAVDNLEY